jgi:electron transfer flavoprotein beta subunit
VEAKFPVLITVHGSAAPCRFRNAKRVMQYKKACTISEQQEKGMDYSDLWNQKPYLKIEEWTAEDLNPDMSRLGMSGSPTKVKNIENVVLTQKESVVMSDKEDDINSLMKELISSHIIG